MRSMRNSDDKSILLDVPSSFLRSAKDSIVPLKFSHTRWPPESRLRWPWTFRFMKKGRNMVLSIAPELSAQASHLLQCLQDDTSHCVVSNRPCFPQTALTDVSPALLSYFYFVPLFWFRIKQTSSPSICAFLGQ